jgi:predicted esterase
MRRIRPSPGSFQVNVNIPFEFKERRPENPKGLVLLMHGYGQTGAYIFDKLEKYIPREFAVLAPNAPFPMYLWDATFPSPGWRDRKVRMGYTWYFYDSKTGEYLTIGMEPSLESLTAGMRHLNLVGLPTVVIGFSQGGYVAPFIAQKVETTKQVIGIGCEFLAADLEGGVPYRTDAIFGDSDKIASLEAGRKSHEDFLKKTGKPGDFHVIQGLDHEITAAVGEKIKEIFIG